MKKINNKLIFFSLVLLAFMAFNGAPKTANAYYYVGFVNGNYIGCYTDLDNYGNFVGCGHVNNTVYNKTNTVNSTTSVASTKTNTTNKNITSNTKDTTVKTENTDVSKKTSDKSNDSLSANALFGSNGFMPSNIFQWILLFILILLLVMIGRKMVKENKGEQPLKHA
ncbi:MAG: hypothetical protein WCX46_01760 [Candidatus Paceibacterota bacterium]